MIIDAQKLNSGSRKWLRETVDAIIQDMHAKGVRHREYSKSREAIFLLVKGRLKTKFGVAERLSISFPKHLVFVKYGVGKYRPKGSGKEVPKDIVDNILEARLPLLGDVAAEAWADMAVNNLFIDKSRAQRA